MGSGLAASARSRSSPEQDRDRDQRQSEAHEPETRRPRPCIDVFCPVVADDEQQADDEQVGDAQRKPRMTNEQKRQYRWQRGGESNAEYLDRTQKSPSTKPARRGSRPWASRLRTLR